MKVIDFPDWQVYSKCMEASMAVKTITIDIEAYDILSKSKNAGESFSEVIKRRLRKRSTASALLLNLDNYALRDDTLESLETVIAKRNESASDSEIIDKD
jgi:predicted CopG family antitoxin